MSRIHWITADDPPDHFPPDDTALVQPNGLIAAGGDLSPERLLAAYRRGIFPWYEEGQEILWWTPDPRTVIRPPDIHLSRRLLRTIRNRNPRLSLNTAFGPVIDACAAPRPGHSGTWITPDMNSAYRTLHRLGHAHSLEVWLDEVLAGGIYGVAIGRVFFGESMFSNTSDGSKIALGALAKWLQKSKFGLIDGQMQSAHLTSMGSVELPRVKFVRALDEFCTQTTSAEVWEKRENIEVGWT